MRKYRQKMLRTSGILLDNPVLVHGLGITLIIAASTTLQKGLVLSLLMFITTVPIVVLDAIVDKHLQGWQKIALYTFISMALIQMTELWLSKYPLLIDSLGIYLPIMAVNTVMTYLAVDAPRMKGAFPSALRALAYCTGFSLVICIISALREIAGFGTLFDHPLEMDLQFPGILLPFCGFIVLGFSCAAFRFIDHNIKAILYRRPSAVAVQERF